MKWRWGFATAIIICANFSHALDLPSFTRKGKSSLTSPTPLPTPFAVTAKCPLKRPALKLASYRGTHPHAAGKPFWKSKPDLYKKIIEDKKIVVSAKVTEEDSLRSLKFLTAGHIRAPMVYTFDQLTDYDALPKKISYVKEAKHDPNTSNLFMHGALLGFHVRMTIKLAEFQISPDERLISWHVIGGGLVGMKGEILLSKYGEDRTEISMNGDYTGKTIPIPKVILNWGLEIAAQRAAGIMRELIEESFSKCQ